MYSSSGDMAITIFIAVRATRRGANICSGHGRCVAHIYRGKAILVSKGFRQIGYCVMTKYEGVLRVLRFRLSNEVFYADFFSGLGNAFHADAIFSAESANSGASSM
jgi:hypothetical protein